MKKMCVGVGVPARACVSTIHYNDIDLLRGKSSDIIAATVSFGGQDGVLICVESAKILTGGFMSGTARPRVGYVCPAFMWKKNKEQNVAWSCQMFC